MTDTMYVPEGWELVPEEEARAAMGKDETETGWRWFDPEHTVNRGPSGYCVLSSDFGALYGADRGWLQRVPDGAQASPPADDIQAEDLMAEGDDRAELTEHPTVTVNRMFELRVPSHHSREAKNAAFWLMECALKTAGSTGAAPVRRGVFGSIDRDTRVRARLEELLTQVRSEDMAGKLSATTLEALVQNIALLKACIEPPGNELNDTPF